MSRFSLSHHSHQWWLRSLLALGIVLGLTSLAPVAQMPWPASLSFLEEPAPDSGPPVIPQSPAQQRQLLMHKLGAHRWHTAGQRGAGVKIAILDSGFRGYRDFLGGILPANVTVRSFRNDGNLEARDSQHGILCAEVIRALAPDAELLFANWEPDRPDKFLEAVRWAKQQGARIISCSLIMPSWSDGEGGGSVNEGLAGLIGEGKAPGDLLCFASAGNTAQRHWSGTFRANADGYHEWQTGEIGNELMPWGTERVSVELYGQFAGRARLSVHDARTGALINSAPVSRAKVGGGGASAIVRFLPQANRRYQIRFQLEGNKTQNPREVFHIVALGAHLGCVQARGSIPCPADCRNVHAVGAVDGEGQRHVYSSCGPNSKLPKPDLVAEVPFPSLFRPRAFAGTSAAAPQAAAVAALLWGRNPDWTAAQISGAMKRALRDLGEVGHDYETGHGCVTLP